MKTVGKDEIIIKAPIARLMEAVRENILIAERLQLTMLKEFGVLVIKNIFDKRLIYKLRTEYDRSILEGTIRKDDFHRTQVRISKNSGFLDVLNVRELKELLREIFPEGTGLDFFRIVKKDSSNPLPVFLHSDSSYNIGWYDAFSVFIPLSICNSDNGGLSFYPGTHHFGHTGDAGGLAEILPPGYPSFQPDANPGDLIIMHAGVWHKSPAYRSGDARIYLEFNFRSAKDPAAKHIIDVVDDREWILKIDVDDLFADSREQRVTRLTQQLKDLKGA